MDNDILFMVDKNTCAYINPKIDAEHTYIVLQKFTPPRNNYIDLDDMEATCQYDIMCLEHNTSQVAYTFKGEDFIDVHHGDSFPTAHTLSNLNPKIRNLILKYNILIPRWLTLYMIYKQSEPVWHDIFKNILQFYFHPQLYK